MLSILFLFFNFNFWPKRISDFWLKINILPTALAGDTLNWPIGRFIPDKKKTYIRTQLYFSYCLFVPDLPTIEVKKNAGNWLCCWRFPTILVQQSFHSNIFYGIVVDFFLLPNKMHIHVCVWEQVIWKIAWKKCNFIFRKCNLLHAVNTHIPKWHVYCLFFLWWTFNCKSHCCVNGKVLPCF